MQGLYPLPFQEAIPTASVSASAAGKPIAEAEPRPARFPKQLRNVQTLMADGRWRSLQEVADATGWPPASVSARLRDLRKPGHGAHSVHVRRRMIGGHLTRLREYRLAVRQVPNA